MTFQHCCIIGLGLLGGSLALDLRRRCPGLALTGVARRPETREAAAELRDGDAAVFTRVAAELSSARDADLVVLCTPVQTIIAHLAQLGPHLSPGDVVTDVGSTKRVIMNAAAAALPPGVSFVGGHPMAGSERAGMAHARCGLFEGAAWALCVPEGAEEAARRLSELITALGALPLPIAPDLHDALVAQTSHLPHIVAAALASYVLGGPRSQEAAPFIAGGFRDATRMAAGSPVMWRDICLTNRDHLAAALDTLGEELARWREAIRGGDAAHLEALLTMASERRARLRE